MSARLIRSCVARVLRRLRTVLRIWNGDAEYQRYVQHCTTHGRPALDRGHYFAERLEERYRTTSRCC